MEDDVREAIDELRDLVRQGLQARTPERRQEARNDVREAREDLETVLRREGYSFSRKELDALTKERDYQAFRTNFDRMMDEVGRDDDDDDQGDDDDAAAKAKPKTRRKPAGKPASGKPADDDDDEEWV
jgi:hypothetical protein